MNFFERFNLKLPLIQGGMAVGVSTATLAGAVAREGGIGIIGATGMSCDELKQEIRQARTLANNGVIGVNIMFAIRNFGELVKIAIQEKVDLIISGAGFSRDIFNWGREADIPIVTIVSTSRLAQIAEKFGAAAVVAEGTEAGGHLGTDKSTYELIPEIKASVKIPVIAAGGITDCISISEMMNLGADGVQLGTRFVLSEECTVAKSFKEYYLNAREEDVVIIKSPVGLPGRALKNVFSEALGYRENHKHNCDHCLKVCSQDYCILQALKNSRDGDLDQGIIFAGKNVFKIKEVLSVKKIIENFSQAFCINTT